MERGEREGKKERKGGEREKGRGDWEGSKGGNKEKSGREKSSVKGKGEKVCTYKVRSREES